MEMPLVSIIVPVYNAQSHLSRCLESICGQEYKNLELIVINDGSSFRMDNMPYGGVKDSGMGKEGPEYAIRELTEEKTIIMNFD